MAQCTVQEVCDDVRGILSDIAVSGGETFTNTKLLGTGGAGSLFGEAYRTMYSKLSGLSRRVQQTVSIVLPAQTTVVIPSAYGITDFSEPELLEERPATETITISTTSATTPITVTTATDHGLATGALVSISGVLSSFDPWGQWFITVTGTDTFTLNGSVGSVAGTSGVVILASVQSYTEVFPGDLPGVLDGQASGVLGNYLWQRGRLSFRGATQDVEIRITYIASGTAPTAAGTTIWLDNARDFLAYATAASAARSVGWLPQYQLLREKAFGDPSRPMEESLLDLFCSVQILQNQRFTRRALPFREHRPRWGGSYILG